MQNFLKEAEKSTNSSDYINKIDKESFSIHVLASLLLIPTDYKPDKLIVDNNNRIIGIGNDAALESFELSKNSRLGKHKVEIKNILYFLPLMKDTIDKQVKENFLQHHHTIFLLNWLFYIHNKQKNYDLFIETGLVDNKDSKSHAMKFLDLPLKFIPKWISHMRQRFVQMQSLIRSTDEISHQKLFKEIHPFASRYYEAIQTVHSFPLDQITYLYKPEKLFEELLQDANLFDQEFQLKLLQHENIFNGKSNTLTNEEAIQELVQTVNFEDFELSQQLEWLEHVAQVGIFPEKLHSSWNDCQLLIRIISESASERVIKMLIEKTKLNVNELDEKGCNVLHASVRKSGSISLVQLSILVNAGSRTEIEKFLANMTPLDIAADNKDLAVFKCLIDLGAGEKAKENIINRFYQQLTESEKEDLSPYLIRLAQINPKLGWSVSS